MQGFVDALNVLAERLAQETVGTHHRWAEPQELPPEAKLEKAWGSSHPQGLEIRADAHFAQMTKTTTARLYVYEGKMKTSFETVCIGVAVLRWRQIWGARVGGGYFPYVRYETTCGNVFLYASIAEAEEDEERAFVLEHYLGRIGDGAEELRLAVAAHREVQPFISGWIEDDPDRIVWSEGHTAVETMLTAIEKLRKQDLFGGGPERYTIKLTLR